MDAHHVRREIAKKDPKQTVVTLDPKIKAEWEKKLEGAIAEWSQTRPGIDKIRIQYRQLLADVGAGK